MSELATGNGDRASGLDAPGLVIRRLDDNPIIVPSMLPGDDGANINGPSLIEAPDWLPGRLGRFYLYFAHHSGRYIRLAYADHLAGPWRIHPPGTLTLAQAVGCRHHIASPDVHVDHDKRTIFMYFHGVPAAGRGQLSYFAHSGDGLNFVAEPRPVADFYLRAIPWRQYWLGASKGGRCYLASAYDQPFRLLKNPLLPMGHPRGDAPGDLRHLALAVAGNRLEVYFSRIGDQPEAILRGVVDLNRHPSQWRLEDIRQVLAPEHSWEGADLPVTPSKFGAAHGRENALRDPALFTSDGRRYLLYSVAGESGIAIAEILEPTPQCG